MNEHWCELDRAALAAEALCHAIDLFDRNASPALVIAVGHLAWQFYFDRARPPQRGRHTPAQMVEILRTGCGDSFDQTWLRERAFEVLGDLKRVQGRAPGPQPLRIAALSPVLLLICCVTEARDARDRERLAQWRAHQLRRLDEIHLSDPEVAARRRVIGNVRSRAGMAV